MAKVHETANGNYECRWSGKDRKTGKRKFYKQRFRLKKDALAKAREVEDRAANLLSVSHKAGKQTVEFWANEWHRDYADSESVSDNTARTARVALSATVIPYLGQMPIRDVQRKDVADFIEQVRARTTKRGKVTPDTVRFHYVTLRNVLRFAELHKAISHNPAVDFRLPTNKAKGRLRRKHTFLDADQVQLLARAMPEGTHYGLLIRFLAATGLRVGECAGLNMEDVDLKNRVVYVHRTRQKVKGGWAVGTPKSGEARKVPLIGKGLAASLEHYLSEHPHAGIDDAPFWPGRRLEGYDPKHGGNRAVVDWGEPWNPVVFYKTVFKPTVLRTPGIPDALRQHDLRHTFASIMADSGQPAARIAQWMGHADEVVTRTIYIGLFDPKDDDLASLDDAFGDGGGLKSVPVQATA